MLKEGICHAYTEDDAATVKKYCLPAIVGLIVPIVSAVK